MPRMGWDEWNLALIPPGKILSDGRTILRKATTRHAMSSYRPLIEANNCVFLKNVLEMGVVGDPSSLVHQ